MQNVALAQGGGDVVIFSFTTGGSQKNGNLRGETEDKKGRVRWPTEVLVIATTALA